MVKPSLKGDSKWVALDQKMISPQPSQSESWVARGILQYKFDKYNQPETDVSNMLCCDLCGKNDIKTSHGLNPHKNSNRCKKNSRIARK
jgi:hypothetical protein